MNHRFGRIRGLAATSLLGAAMLTGVAAADDAFQDALAQKMEAVEAWREGQTGRPNFQEVAAKMNELFGDMDFSTASGGELVTLMMDVRELGAAQDLMARIGERLAECEKAPDFDGAEAAVGRLMMVRDPGGLVSGLEGAINHPAFEKSLRDGHGAIVLQYLNYLQDEQLMDMADEVATVARAMPDTLEPENAMGAPGVVMAMNKLGDKLPAELRAATRQKVVGILESAIANAEEEGVKSAMKDSLKLLNGPYGRGELIDHAAPVVAFNWNSGDKRYASLQDLKGKVVVLDFWATWCGPCIGSFPQVRELQKRYEGYDVVVVGVTSLQGSHYPGDGPPVDTEGDPEKEYQLMTEFMKAKDMTWMVAFSEDNVFNPNFGVRGIPHVAIVDPAGKVRYNGLHPAVDPEKKYEKIDALLKEANLPAPAPVGPVEEKTG